MSFPQKSTNYVMQIDLSAVFHKTNFFIKDGIKKNIKFLHSNSNFLVLEAILSEIKFLAK